MEFIIDTINLEEIKDAVDHLPIVGVTSNPSIVKATAPENFFDHMREIRRIIGTERSLHIQVTALTCEGMIKEAERITKEIDDQVYIK
ncbi:MAG: fructose-bisphosphate aldolase, partial [Erysipelotrichaceae bacterium]|nr:fructose-bisphosphate aldolase [Erysipelotrichaceae bacterium]